MHFCSTEGQDYCMNMDLLPVVVLVVLVVLDFDSGHCKTGQIGKSSIRSNALQHVEHSEDEIGLEEIYRRNRLSKEVGESGLNASEIREVLQAHNTRRRLEMAADMEIMNWNKVFARMAEDWAKNCLWAHGQPPQRDISTLPYSWVGQNLYAVSGASTISLTSAIHNWYEEKTFYDYDTQRCQAGKMCGHYTQIVWSNSREIGCAYARCRTLPPKTLTNAVYLVCNYGPGGNYNKMKPYKTGLPCTKCESGSLWCNHGLCDGRCVKAGPRCECSPVCLNKGTVNRATCSCTCQPGWYGPDCSLVCEDRDPKCSRGVGGWPPSWCNHLEHGAMVQENCPAMCKLCQRTSQ